MRAFYKHIIACASILGIWSLAFYGAIQLWGLNGEKLTMTSKGLWSMTTQDLARLSPIILIGIAVVYGISLFLIPEKKGGL